MATDSVSAPGASLSVPARPEPTPLRIPARRPWKRAAFLVVLIGFAAWGAVLIASTMATPETGPQLTHTITRSDLTVTITEQGLVESSENFEIKSKVRGRNAVLWIIESGSIVKPGDELIRLDSLFIQEQIDERTKYANWSQSAADNSKARVARAKLAVSEYEQGRFVAEKMNVEKELVIAETRLRTAQNRLSHAKIKARSEYISELEVEERQFAVDQAGLNVELMRKELDVLSRFTRKEQLQTLKGDLKAVEATHNANVERAMADGSRRDRALDEIKHCVVKADRGGLVIHPNAAKWESGPIAEGTRVWKNQVLLLMPNLSKMQVKVGIHESIVDRIKVGLKARVTLPTRSLSGTVSSVASVTRPASWWTGNEVTYDTLIKLPPEDGIRPGMSAEVEVIIAEYKDVLTIPVAAVVESNDLHSCWVKTSTGMERRQLKLGDSNGIFTVAESGLKEGDEVILNPPKPATAEQATDPSTSESGPSSTDD